MPRAWYQVVGSNERRKDLGPFALAPLLFSALLAQWFVRESFAVPACAELEKAGMGPAL
jgi:hypothetical protein